MQKLKLQNVYNKQTKSFDKNVFEIRETDGTISGKVSISGKKGDKWISKPMPFTVFKSKVDADTIDTILHSKGQVFEAECNIVVDSFTDKETNKEVTYLKLIINKAVAEKSTPISKHSVHKGNGYQPQEEDQDDEIPF